MSRTLILVALSTAAALGWWALAPARFAPPSIAGFSAPPKSAAAPDPIKIAVTRWRSPGRKSLFEAPVVGAAAPIQAAQVRLVGASAMPGRHAALISVNGAAPFWLEAGQSQDGMSLIEVRPGRAVVRTPDGGEVSLSVFAAPKPKADNAG